MKFHKQLFDSVLIQANLEEAGWHSSNYSLMKISPSLMQYFDYEENLIQQFEYEIDDLSNILLLPDKEIFGKIKQQNENRLDILQEEGGILHFFKAPETTVQSDLKDYDTIFERSKWTTQQLGFQMNFQYIPASDLGRYKENTGLPVTEINNQMEFGFTLVNPFQKWFLIMFADQIMVDALPIHMIGNDTIEVYASLSPQAIRVLKRI